MNMLSIGELAKRSGLGAVAIRYYEKQKIIQAPKRSEGNHRLYSEEVLATLLFIQNAKHAGFSLNEIKQLLKLQQSKQATSQQVKNFTKAKLISVQKKIQHLQKIQQLLEALINACDGKGKTDRCCILKKLYTE